MQQNTELGNVGQDQIFLHFWVHFPSPTPLSTYKGHLYNFSFTRYHNSIWWKASLIDRLGNNLWIAPCYCSLILPHPIHLYCILIWKLVKLVKCTLNALVRLTYSRYINVRFLENVLFTRIDKAGGRAIFS